MGSERESYRKLLERAAEQLREAATSHSYAVAENRKQLLAEIRARLAEDAAPPSVEAATPWLNIYSPPFWHADAEIVGTTAGLLGLRNAVDAAVVNGRGSFAPFAHDGEGYDLNVTRVDDNAMREQRPHYTDTIAAPAQPAAWREPLEALCEKWESMPAQVSTSFVFDKCAAELRAVLDGSKL